MGWFSCSEYAQQYIPFAYQIITIWHMPLVCSIIFSHCILKCITIIWSIPMCYTKYHNLNRFSFIHLISLTSSFILAVSGHDILRPLGIWFRPFIDSVRDTKYRRHCIMLFMVKTNRHIYSMTYLSYVALQYCSQYTLSCMQIVQTLHLRGVVLH